MPPRYPDEIGMAKVTESKQIKLRAPSLLWPGALFIFKSSLLWDDLTPVAVRIIDKVDDHILIFITDAAHFFMQGMSACEIVDFESQMGFIVTQIVRLLSIF